jgi:quercetin 2,3-dioxygenase
MDKQIIVNSVVHRSESRGHADYGWLKTNYTFSFANYYNPERIHFGALRVLNDDWVNAGQGFGRHPHDNMEIVTIPLEGELEHKDSMGNTFQIRKNDVQIMSAGTGIFHSEYNRNPDKPVRLLQIWVFPEEKNIKPRYDQRTFDPEQRKNNWQRIVSPDEPDAVWINQKAYFSMISLDENMETEYFLRDKKNGVYIFVINGKLNLPEIELNTRDGLGIWDVESVPVSASVKAEILVMEIPMEVR